MFNISPLGGGGGMTGSKGITGLRRHGDGETLLCRPLAKAMDARSSPPLWGASRGAEMGVLSFVLCYIYVYKYSYLNKAQ